HVGKRSVSRRRGRVSIGCTGAIGRGRGEMAEGQSGDDWADDGQASLRQRAGRLSARYFHDGELFLRSQDRVHYLKVTGRAQKWLAGVALGALCWVGYSTLAFFLSGYLVDAKDREITRQEVAYSALLAQASDFQAQAEQLSET